MNTMDPTKAGVQPGITRTTAEEVVDWIIAQIGAQRFTPGQRLIEASIARELGTGTVPVREALRVLAGDNVVEILPHRGARICIMDRKQVADMLKAMMALFFVAIDEIEADPSKLNPLIPRLKKICETLARLEREKETAAILETMQEYMLSIIEASGNSYIMKTLNRFRLTYYNLQILSYVGPNSIRKNGVDHDKLTIALENQQFAKARKILSISRDRAISDLLDRPIIRITS